MTISDNLQLSVLSAPLASIDRRGLSQAWYSALYARPASPQRNASAQTPKRAPASSVLKPATIRPARAKRDTLPPPSKHRAQRDPGVTSPVPERRTRILPLAKRIAATIARSKKTSRAASFKLGNTRGRVQIIVRERGERVDLVAICAPDARHTVAEALAQARYALAARGFALEARTQSAA